MYVSDRTPWRGRVPAGRYMLGLVSVNSKRRISQRLFSDSLVVGTVVLQPTPLCQMV